MISRASAGLMTASAPLRSRIVQTMAAISSGERSERSGRAWQAEQRASDGVDMLGCISPRAGTATAQSVQHERLCPLGHRCRHQARIKQRVTGDYDAAAFVAAGAAMNLGLGRLAEGPEKAFRVKEVKLGERRYIVCRNEAEANKDAADRAAVLEGLERQLQKGDKVLVGNSAYRRLLRTTGKTTDKVFQIDPGKVADEARFDGIFVLRTNATISPLQAVLRYRDLLQVETLFRNAKALLRTRPIYHQSDAAIRGHVFCSFLALVLQKELADRCSAQDFKPEWGDVLRDLDRLEDITVADQSGELVLRTDAIGCVPRLFQSVGVAVPPRLRNLKPPPKTEPPTKRRRGRPSRGATRP